ncbi:MAG: acyltransferase domain-containing protein [Flavobacteriales bacterium]|nr:acyltransferase domain-containing protein [Flavobacteriales bacterium]
MLFASDAVLFFSASDKERLLQQLKELLQHKHLNTQLVYLHNCKVKESGSYRLFLATSTADELRLLLEKVQSILQNGVRREGRIAKGAFYASTERGGKVAFVFPGQGCQFPGMGTKLAKRYPTVQKWVKRLDSALLETEGEAISHYYYTGKYKKILHPKLFDLDIGACIVNTISLAYYELMTILGVKPDVFLGLSTGESTALVASNRLSHGMQQEVFETTTRDFVDTYRSAIAQHDAPKGTLYSVGMLNSEAIRACFPKSEKDIYIALDNCPNQKIIFCPNAVADQLLLSLQKAGGLVDVMPFHYAYHTPLFETIAKELKPFYQRLRLGSACGEVYSCISAAPFSSNDSEARILVSHLLQGHVRFQETIENLYEAGVFTFIEVGPKNNVSAFLNDCLQGKDVKVISTGHGSLDEVEAFVQMIGQLFVSGHIHDVAKLFGQEGEYERVSTAPPKISQVKAKQKVLDQTALLHGHFDLMQIFLQQQSRIMNLLPKISQSKQEDSRAYFLLGEQLTCDTKQSRWVREVTLEKEPYLLHHTFGGFSSLRDKSRTALPVIPFTFSLETIVEAAVTLMGESCEVKRIYDLRALSWFVYLRHPISLDIQAQILHDNVVLCRIFNVVNGKRKLSFESKVEFGNKESIQAISSGFSPSGKVDFPYHRNNFYLDDEPVKPWVPGEFHGPPFQAVQAIKTMGNDGVVAELKALSRNGLFQNEDSPQFLIDPIMLDASMHLSTFWVHSRFGVDLTVLPFQVKSYQYFSAPVPEGEKIVVKMRIQYVQTDGSKVPENASYKFFDKQGNLLVEHFINDKGSKSPPTGVAYHQLWPETLAIQSDAEYFDEQGNLLAKLNGNLDKHFSIPVVYNRFTEYPSHYFLAEQNKGEYVLETLNTVFLYSSGKVWLYKLAWLVFSAQEWQEWLQMDNEIGLDYLYKTAICKDIARAYWLNSDRERYSPVDLNCQRVDETHEIDNTESWLCTISSEPNKSPLQIRVQKRDGYYTAKLNGF